MDFVGRNQNKDRSNAVVPENTVQLGNPIRCNPLNLPEIDERSSILAKHAVERELLEGASESVGLWSSGAVNLRCTGEEDRRPHAVDTKFLPPFCRRRSSHESEGLRPVVSLSVSMPMLVGAPAR